MDEHEVKILGIDETKLIQSLNQLGAECIIDADVLSHYYDAKGEVLRKSERMLRLRKTGKRTFLTFKVDMLNPEMKIYKEYEVDVADFNKTNEIIEQLGYTPFAIDHRHERTFKLPNATITINKLPNIPIYAEIETESKEKLREVVEILGYTMADTKPWSGKDVINHYHKTKEK